MRCVLWHIGHDGPAGALPGTIPRSVTASHGTRPPVYMGDSKPRTRGVRRWSGSLYLPYPSPTPVRSGLVVLGLALALVGAGVTLTGLLAPVGSDSTHALLNSISAPNIAPNQTRVAVILMTNTSSGSLALSWSATNSLTVKLFQGVRCTGESGYCAVGSALASWPANTSGSWNRTGPLAFPFLFSMYNFALANLTLRGTLAESFTVGPNSLPTWALAIILVGGVTLVAIGVIAVFLGLFLRSGVYTQPEAVTPRYAHELARPGDPLDEPFEDDDLTTEDAGNPPPTH